jgi:hypothetical protein
MTPKAMYFWRFVFLLCTASTSLCQSRPPFCDAIPDDLLGGLAAPYARQHTPDGTAYCEGLLRTPIAMQAASVISLKQDQLLPLKFNLGQIAKLTWCADSEAVVHIRIRSTKVPLFALDAEHSGQFEWRADLISRWQPDWSNSAVLGTREIMISGHSYGVVIPVRLGAGYSSIYSFEIKSGTPVNLTRALIEPIEPPGSPFTVRAAFSVGPTKDTWIAKLPFTQQNGVYSVTFEETVQNAGVMTEPIYVLHKKCAAQ